MRYTRVSVASLAAAPVADLRGAGIAVVVACSRASPECGRIRPFADSTVFFCDFPLPYLYQTSLPHANFRHYYRFRGPSLLPSIEMFWI